MSIILFHLIRLCSFPNIRRHFLIAGSSIPFRLGARLLLDAHLIDHALYAIDRAGDFDRAVDLRLIVDETA